MPSLTVRAYAKINLALYVLGKRADGYHEIATILQAVDLADTLTFVAGGDDLRFSTSDPALPADEGNLVVRAVRALEREAGRSLPAQVHLEKVVPVGAGLGGGSSDAAVTLWALDRLFGLGFDTERLRALGATLGSDVPFFFTSGQALATGRGERLRELDLPTDYGVTIAYPNLQIRASEAYARAKCSLTNPLADCSFRRYPSPEKFWTWIGSHDNDLACGITATYPVVARGIEAMRSLGAGHAGMTGSGSAVFGLFPSFALAEEAKKNWPLLDAWAVWSVRPLKTPRSVLPAAGEVTPGGQTCGDHRGSNCVEE